MKKCFAPDSGATSLLLLLLLSSSAALAAPVPARLAIEPMLRKDLDTHARAKNPSFDPLLKQWEASHGDKLSPALEKLATDRKLKDESRYIALMGLARLGKPGSMKTVLSLAKDPSWMVRSGTLKAIELTRTPGGTAVAEKLLNDKALVIRTQAVETLIELRPPNLSDLLISAAFDSRNYRGGDYRKGRAEWVPQRALAGLRKVKPRGVSSKLLPLLTEAHDPHVRAHALFTIESLEGKKLEPKASFEKRAKAWTQHFSKPEQKAKPQQGSQQG